MRDQGPRVRETSSVEDATYVAVLAVARPVKPPWYRPIARYQWRRALRRWADGPPVESTSKTPIAPSSWVQQMAERRSQRLRDALNKRTDEICVDADTCNGVSFYGMQRALRNREGEQ